MPSTVLAAGGINAAFGNVDDQDSWMQHFADTTRRPTAWPTRAWSEIMAQEAPRDVLEMDEWGCRFARTPDGKIDQRYFGASHLPPYLLRRRFHRHGRFLFTLDRKVAELGIRE